MNEITEFYDSELAKHRPTSPKGQRRIRDRIVRSQGQLNYDHIKREFAKLASGLNWPKQATLKDFRHLFSTSLENAGVPEYFRKYLMGQSFGRSPIVAYTHITEDKLRQHYLRAVDTELSDIVVAIKRRHRELAMQNDRTL